MKPSKFRELTDKLADVVGEIRDAGGGPTAMLSVLDNVLRSQRWPSMPIEHETRSDALMSGGVLRLRVTLEVVPAVPATTTKGGAR